MGRSFSMERGNTGVDRFGEFVARVGQQFCIFGQYITVSTILSKMLPGTDNNYGFSVNKESKLSMAY